MSGSFLSKSKGYLASRLPWVWAASACGLALPALAPLATEPTLAWFADLAIHWQWQYAVIGVLSSVIYLAMQRSRLGAAMVFATVAMVTLNFGALILGRIDQVNGDQSLVVASFNLNLYNHHAPGLEDWVKSGQPDVLALYELTSQHAHLVERLQKSLPHALIQPQDDPFGVAVLSKLPLEGAQVKKHLQSTPFIEARITVHGKQVMVRAIHPMPPISGPDRATRDALIKAVAKRSDEPLVVAGDFNASPWTPAMRQLTGGGVKRATSFEPTHTLYGGLPIDHILASEADWSVSDAGVAGNFGSDHRLIWARLIAR